MRKEGFKTLLLTMLFVLSVGLTQQLWVGIPMAEILPATKDVENNEIKNYDITTLMMNVISPQSFAINFGGGYHTVFFSDAYNIWSEAVPILKAYFEQEVAIEEINMERWTSVNDFRSIRVDFDYDMPISVLKNVVQGKDLGLQGKISSFRSLLIPVTEEATLYISSPAESKFYRVRAREVNGSMAEIINTIEQNGFDHYFAVKDIMGVENNTLMPIALSEDISKIKVVQEVDTTNTRQVEPLAGTFFGENFDFVRKITETSGTVIYMYGYGQKALKIDASGTVEYNEEADGRPVLTAEVTEALRAAVKFVTEHGDWPKEAYLKGIVERDKKRGYLFLFGYRINGLPIYYYDKVIRAPIEVEVTGRQVTAYKRYVKREKIDVTFIEKLDNRTILTPQQVLDINFDYIKSIFLGEVMETDEEIEENEVLKEILSSIDGVELGYYEQPMGERDSLIPIWIIKLKTYQYYFDAYKGTILNRSEL
ncbi:YycH family regulatory protein [Geosporobacter ferrireducens]|uniref:Regulatory protein YycH domain-containing protein n=1 Tax=Geosporobacter ferrireducens TaxID=1424294 RepID=A0A1D8GI15_9FIRM|nr:two-component system activity regulator YycH [Geosporobacter ferrireducens]AOT70547.1 hypothetical protein Gferi_13780 [Geosporobacter ferrireducens]